MTLKEYIEHKNEKEREKEQDNISDEEEDTMMDEIEKKINQLMEICKKIKQLNTQKIFKFSVNYYKINFKPLKYLINK